MFWNSFDGNVHLVDGSAWPCLESNLIGGKCSLYVALQIRHKPVIVQHSFVFEQLIVRNKSDNIQNIK